jgi:hypothetical protein
VRSLLISLAAAIAIAAAVPSAAPAAKGWKLPNISNDVSGLKVTGKAARCGKSKFGMWRWRGTMSAEGKVAYLRWKVRLTKDGALHPLAKIRVTGTAPEVAQQAMKSSLSKQRMRYVPGSPAQVETVGSTGERAGIREFRPTRTRRC